MNRDKETTKKTNELDYSKPVVSLEFDGPHIKIGRIKNMELEELIESDLDISKSKENIVQQVFELIQKVITKDVVGIGIGVPGIVDLENGIAFYVRQIDAWDEIHLKKLLEDQFNVPTYLNNDANCFALGVKYFGKGKYYRDMVGLIVAGGIGGGVIINNKLFSGVNCGVGEFGQMPYLDGVLEDYTCTQFFSKIKGTDFNTIYHAAKSSDKNAIELFNEFGKHLGKGLITIVSAINPELIVFGGDMVKAFNYYKESMWETIKTIEYLNTIENLKIEITDDPNISLLGAAALYYDAQEGNALERERKRRKDAENELLQERNTLFAILENIPDMIYSKNKEKQLTKVNRAFLEYYGFKNEKSVIGKSHHTLFKNQNGQSSFNMSDKIFKTTKPIIDLEEEHIQNENKSTWLLSSIIPILDSIGDVSDIVGISRDITERKIAEEKLQRFSERLRLAKREADNILRNVDEGLFLLDSDLKIGSQYSSCLKDIFGINTIAKRNLISYLRDKITKTEIETAENYLNMMFDDSYDEQLLEELAPMSKIELNFGKAGFKYFSFKFKRIINDSGKTDELIAVVKDITEQTKLEQRLRISEERAKQQTELILNIIHVEPSMLISFMEDFKTELSAIDIYFSKDVDKKEIRQVLEKVIRSIHLIKGNASILDLKLFAKLTHDFENSISDVQKKDSISKDDFIFLLDQYNDIKNNVEEVETLISKLSQIHSIMRPKRNYEKKAFINSVKNFIMQSAKDKNKKVSLDINNFYLDKIPYQYLVLTKNILIQLIRNSLAHGIESPEERKTKGKDEQGLIEISTQTEENEVILKYRDDGRGIQIEKLRSRLKKDKRWDNQKINSLSDHEITQTIFTSGISTSERSDLISGRGVGMDAIKEKINKNNGSINLSYDEERWCEFSIRLPIKDSEIQETEQSL